MASRGFSVSGGEEMIHHLKDLFLKEPHRTSSRAFGRWCEQYGRASAKCSPDEQIIVCFSVENLFGGGI